MSAVLRLAGTCGGAGGVGMMHLCAATAIALPRLSEFLHFGSPAEQLSNTPFLIYASLFFSLAAVYLALGWMAPDYRIFRAMSVYLTLSGIQTLWLYAGGVSTNWALVSITAPVLVAIGGDAMRVPNRRWTLLIWPFSLLVLGLGWVHGLHFLRPLPVDVSDLILLVLTVQAYRRGVRRDRQIAIAFAFFLLIRGSLSSDIQALTHLPAAIVVSGWSWAVTPAAIIPLGLATLVIFVRDLVDDRREKLRMAAELEAARSVQHVLIPEDVPAVPDFAIESAYQPAGEVGGDFFQILPLPGGGVLVVIGDVSGKGMPAAMTVSLLVGTVQTLAQYTQSPGEILAAMNRRMLARSNGGFTTCLVLRAERGGALTVANAGHIAPYLAGKELPLENGLPLGLSADTSYAESVFELLAGQQLTLVTDGVVEARNRGGDLFGFERTAELSTQPAEVIVQAAQAFGQEDDITALTIALLSL